MISHLLAEGASLLYGFLFLGICAISALKSGSPWRHASEEEKHQLRQAYHNLWSIPTPPTAYTHNFLTTAGGIRLHYLSCLETAQGFSKPLIILLHGFPDSCHVWSFLFSSPLAKRAHLVALDLPGCGGSQSLARYDADNVYNAVSEAIIALREKHGRTGCVLVGHDWGGLISYRIAAQAPGLVDRVVVLNSMHPTHASDVVRRRVASFREGVAIWTRRPWRTAVLTTAIAHLMPVLSQLIKSGYIFMFNLPLPIAAYLPKIARHMLSYCHMAAYRSSQPLPPHLAAHATASSTGPSAHESSAYDPSVHARARAHGAWDQRTALYRQGLATGPWTQSATVAAYQPAARGSAPVATDLAQRQRSVLDADRRRGSTRSVSHDDMFKIPVTVIFGTRDPALDPRICLEGIEAYFVRHAVSTQDQQRDLQAQQSHVIRLPRCGHWAMFEADGQAALEVVLEHVAHELPSDGKYQGRGVEAVEGGQATRTGLQSRLQACIEMGSAILAVP